MFVGYGLAAAILHRNPALARLRLSPGRKRDFSGVRSVGSDVVISKPRIPRPAGCTTYGKADRTALPWAQESPADRFVGNPVPSSGSSLRRAAANIALARPVRVRPPYARWKPATYASPYSCRYRMLF